MRIGRALIAAIGAVAFPLGIHVLSNADAAQRVAPPGVTPYRDPAVTRSGQAIDRVGFLVVDDRHWINSPEGIRICPNRGGGIVAFGTGDAKKLAGCGTSTYSITRYAAHMVGEGAVAQQVTLAPGQTDLLGHHFLTISYRLP